MRQGRREVNEREKETERACRCVRENTYSAFRQKQRLWVDLPPSFRIWSPSCQGQRRLCWSLLHPLKPCEFIGFQISAMAVQVNSLFCPHFIGTRKIGQDRIEVAGKAKT